MRDTAPRFFRVQTTCASTAAVGFSNATRIRTTWVAAPYFENFEGITPAAIRPACITTTLPRRNGFGWFTQWSAAAAFSGSGLLHHQTNSNSANDSTWAFTPGVFLEPGKEYRFAFRGSFIASPNNANNASDTFSIALGTGPSADSIVTIGTRSFKPMSVPLDWNTGSLFNQREIYRHYELRFTVPQAGVYFGGIFRANTSMGFASNNDLYADNLEIREVPAVDVAVDSVLSPAPWAPTCLAAQMPLTITVRNEGTAPVSNIPVRFRTSSTAVWPGTVSAPEVVPGPIPPGGHVAYTFTQLATIPAGTVGVKIQAFSSAAGDGYVANDTMQPVGLRLPVMATVPYLENWQNPLSTWPPTLLGKFGWWSVDTVSNEAFTTGGVNRVLSINFSEITAGWDSVSVKPLNGVTANTFVRFQNRTITPAATPAGVPISAGDTVYLLARSNCGPPDTLLKLHAGSGTGSTAFQFTQPIYLGAYAGTRVHLSFVTRKQSTSNLLFQIDTFEVFNNTPIDVALRSVDTMVSAACPGVPFPISTSLSNAGALPSGNFPIHVFVDASATPALVYTYPATLGFRQRDSVRLGSLSLPATGTYNIAIVSQRVGDTVRTNDTLRRTVVVMNTPQAFPLKDTTGCAPGYDLHTQAPDSSLVMWWHPFNTPPSSPPLQFGSTRTISTTDSFAVAHRRALPLGVGIPARSTNWSSPTVFNGGGLRFRALSDIWIDSVAVYPASTGTLSFELVSCVSCATPVVLGTFTATHTTQPNPVVKQMIPIQRMIRAGNDYAIRTTPANTVSLVREFPFTGFPLTGNLISPVSISSSWSINGPSFDHYYYFYDWHVRALAPCQSPQSRIIGRVLNPPVAAFNVTTSGSTASFSNVSSHGTSSEWHFGDGNTSTAVSPTHTYATPGTYTVNLIHRNACGEDSSTRNVIITGATSVFTVPGGATNALLVHPNPAKELMVGTYYAASRGTTHFQVMAADGRMVSSFTRESVVGENSVEVNVSGLPAGVYFLRLSQGTHRKHALFRVER